MDWRSKKKFEKQQRKRMGDAYVQLEKQLIGALDIELLGYSFRKNLNTYFYSMHYNRNVNGGIDIYIFDRYLYERKFEIDPKTDRLIPDPDYETYGELYHLHPEDLLWFILNWNKEIKRIKKRINEYLRWREE